MKLPIYLDYSATTPVDPRVAEKMMQFLTLDGTFGNPASRSHRFGWQAEEAVDIARNQIAELVGADPREIVFTSGATESDNLAIKGAANFYQKKGKHIITSKTEHKAVLDTCRQLEREGFEVTYLAPQRNGIIDLNELEAAMRDDTILVSIMHVNNEIGVVQDIATIGEMCRARGIIYHVDATQSVGKLPIDLSQLKVDLMSFSGHKFMVRKALARCMCVVSRVFALKRRCMAAGTSAVCALVLCLSTRLSAWAKLTVSRKKRWRPKWPVCAVCVTVCGTASKILKKFT
ncbi:cysteine desulfurase [Salmonella enterica subsp. enterica serovar Berta str. ATCC 8392]|nr:cysteine desulfurase [Salmonella enterica subsp. enterica serovar Berta str. ATCC 8392]